MVVLALLLALWSSTGNTEQRDLLTQGEYVFRAAGCAGCHTDVENDGQFLAGGRPIVTPFGTFYSPNITPDPQYGVGRWNDEDFVRALTAGIAPDGSYYYPVFPYTAYTKMQRDDILALKTYLFSQKPVAQPNMPHELPWYMRYHLINWAWNLLNFSAGEFLSDPEQSSNWNRGAYISKALAHCAECHTPRNLIGGLQHDMLYAGAKNGPDGEVVPNITPDRKTGIGRWSKDDLVYFLETGATPGGDYTGGLMAEVVDNGLQHLSQEDLKALAVYIQSLKPIEHVVKRRKKKKRGEFD